MSPRPIRTCADASSHGFYLEVTCNGCRRIAIFEPGGFAVTRWFKLPIDALGARMLCQPPKGCGHRGATIRFISYPPTPPAKAMPKPIETRTPKGIDPEAWANASDHERKRLVRRARG